MIYQKVFGPVWRPIGWGEICNRTGQDVWFTKAWDDGFFIWDINWTFKGWWEIKQGKCHSENLGYGTMFYAFHTVEGETLVYKPGNVSGNLPIENMCVDCGGSPFNVAVGTNPDNCLAGMRSVPVSFGLRGGDNDISITLE